jgi:hypothetical protein
MIFMLDQIVCPPITPDTKIRAAESMPFFEHPRVPPDETADKESGCQALADHHSQPDPPDSTEIHSQTE